MFWSYEVRLFVWWSEQQYCTYQRTPNKTVECLPARSGEVVKNMIRRENKNVQRMGPGKETGVRAPSCHQRNQFLVIFVPFQNGPHT